MYLCAVNNSLADIMPRLERQQSGNGMIKRFQRRGLKDDGQYGKVDNLHISLDGNRPEKITDDADLQTIYGAMEFRDLADLPQEYYYDGCGSLVADANKGIAHIDYDNLNHPKRIQFTNGNTIEYVYAPDGQKLRATYQTAAGNVVVPLNTTQTITASTTSQTDYMGNVILSGTSSGSSASVSLNKFLFAGGYLSFPTTTTSAFHYYTQDHLGNNRAVVNESGAIEQVTHYYPFGGFFADAGTGSSLQPYKYNGKELDRMHGLDLYDYGARYYDAIVPMFTQQDPLAEKYYNVSPYAYCGNSPVNRIDPDGRKVVNSQGVNIFYINASNQLCVSKHASENEKMVYQGMMLTPTGQKMLRQMIKSPILINMQFKDKCADDKKGEITYADTQQYKKGKDNGITRDKNGKFRTKYSTITFYMKTIEESLGWNFSQNNGLTLTEAIGAEATHESVHASDEEEINKDIASVNNGKPRSKQEAEKKPREIEQQFRDELKNINDGN
jgi:RHS repeat-associated protein